jgi:hypothetical protein
MPALSDDVTVLTLGSRSFTLRASLRALASIARDYHDLQTLHADIARLNLGACLDLIQATTSDPEQFAMVVAITADHALLDTISQVRPQLLSFIEAFSGSNDTRSNAEPVEPITLDELVTRLFQIGAGWLEWSPNEVWEATPAEIITAQQGLIQKLKAIHGSSEDDAKTQVDVKTAKDRLNALGNSRVTNMRDVPLWLDGITLEHRVLYDGQTYRISRLKEIGRRVGLDLVVEHVGP